MNSATVCDGSWALRAESRNIHGSEGSARYPGRFWVSTGNPRPLRPASRDERHHLRWRRTASNREARSAASTSSPWRPSGGDDWAGSRADALELASSVPSRRVCGLHRAGPKPFTTLLRRVQTAFTPLPLCLWPRTRQVTCRVGGFAADSVGDATMGEAMPQRAEIVLSEEQREVVERWARRPESSQALALRCRIVLAAAEGARSKEIAARLGCDKGTVAGGAVASPAAAWTAC
jgi:hypothetical protein